MFSAHLVAVRALIAGVPVLGRSFRYIVVVVGEKPLQEEHHQEATQGQTASSGPPNDSDEMRAE